MQKRALVIVLILAFLVAFPVFGIAESPVEITIINPYEDVIWGQWDAYLGQLHTHSTSSDGYFHLRDVVEYHYYFGFDILALTDHGVVDRGWVGRPNYLPFLAWVTQLALYGRLLPSIPIGLTQERYEQINAGYGRDGRGMIRVPYGIEQNPVSLNLAHVVSLYADWGNAWLGGSADLTNAVRGIHQTGGISIIAHPSETFNRWHAPMAGAWTSMDSDLLRMQQLFERYDSLIGIEIPESQDRVLWDTLLQNLAPAGRNVFGIQASDMHAADRIMRGYTWHMMPENTADNVRVSLETGAFFGGISYMNRYEELERWAKTLSDADFFYNLEHNHSQTRERWDAPRVEYYANPTSYRPYYFHIPRYAKPMVTNIAVDGNTITIEGNEHTLGIQWIADGEVIYRTAGTESTLDLEALLDYIGAYVRVELFSLGGVLYTQPFLLEYEGMPTPTPVPEDFFDWTRIVGTARWLLYPAGRLVDLFWRGMTALGI